MQALIDALPDEVTEDNAEAVAQALTDIDDAKESLTDDELAGLDLTRYDAAANALLALWGEAPADAVETLADDAAPSQDPIDNYYLIDSVEDLYWFANEVNTNSRTNINARLTADIKLNGENKVLNDDGSLISNPSTLQTWTPIGTESTPFKGEFDGQGKTIRGLYFNDSGKDYVSLFGYVGENGTIKDVTLKDSYVSGNERVGGICGYNNGGTLQNCHNTGTVSGAQSVGGVCGENRNSGIIQKCDNAGTVSGTGESIGGVCGVNAANLNSTPTIQECYNTGKVSSTWFRVGGVCGNNNGGTVKKSYNTGTVSGEDTVGGVCGENNYSGTVNGCYTTGVVTGATNFGGVCGYNQNSDTMINCYYLAGTSANAVGRGNEGTNCASKTALQFQNGDVAYLLQSDLNITTQVWGQRIDGTGETDDHPVLNSTSAYTVYKTLNTSHCQGYSNTKDASREHKYQNGVCIYCGEHEPPKEVNGYYQITNQWQLYWFAKWVNGVSPVTNQPHPGANAILVYDITLNSNVLNENGELNTSASANFTPWTPIGEGYNSFKGTFDGNNKTISGLYCNKSNENNVGLFGSVSTGGKVINVTVADSYVSGTSCVGGICGYNYSGTLQNCHNTGTVSGNTNVGGVCGYNYNGTIQECDNTGAVSGETLVGGVCGLNGSNSTVKLCYNTGEVSGDKNNVNVGGVCGANIGTLENSYNTNTVSGGNRVGGVCGENGNTVSGCYNTGKVSGTENLVGSVCGNNVSNSTVKNCYYLDTNTKAIGGGIGVSTNCKSKTALQFRNGDVAFQLQSALGATSPQVWGQRIGTDKTPVLSGDSTYAVHKTAADSPCKGYSNQPNDRRDHNYNNGVCTYCGELQQADRVEEGNYYKISNQGQLRWFANQVNNEGRTDINALLTQDITMDGTEWTPIGTNTHPFTGKFDGKGNTITGLKCTDKNKNYVGLVGYARGATIQDVTVQGSSFNGHIYIGAVCGYITGGTITNCHAVGTTIGDSDRDDDSQYWGGIVGYMTGNNVVTDCTNSGTVSGCWNLGGIAGFAGTNTTVQRCFNSGAVTGRHARFGGIVGQTYNATVQDCGNTGAVSEFTPLSGSQYGGIVGLAESDSTIQNCYNANKNTAAKICGSGQCSPSNCYYLANSSGSTVTGITAKTAEQFASGEVAYLLQKGHTGTTTVWGQTLTGASKQNYPVLNGAPVYQGTPCTGRYSNTTDELNHHYSGGKCIYCGEPEIAYTVTIPAEVTLGNAANATATISAANVTLPTDKTLKVTVNGPFTATLDGYNDVTASYKIKNGNDELTTGSAVLTAQSGETAKTTTLTFVKPDAAPYAGSYTGTVTFTVSVGTKTT